MWPFKARAQVDADGFYDTGVPPSQLAGGVLLPVTVAGEPLLLAQLAGDEIVAFGRYCPHAAADLAKGDWRNGRITCPDHGWKFDARSGRILWPADEACRLPRYAVRLVEGTVRVRVPGKAPTP